MRGQPGLRDLTSKVIEREKCLNSNHIVLNFLRATSVVLAGFLEVTLRNLWDQLLSSLPKSDKWLTRLPQDHSEHVSSPIGGGLGISPLVNLNFFLGRFFCFSHTFLFIRTEQSFHYFFIAIFFPAERSVVQSLPNPDTSVYPPENRPHRKTIWRLFDKQTLHCGFITSYHRTILGLAAVCVRFWLTMCFVIFQNAFIGLKLRWRLNCWWPFFTSLVVLSKKLPPKWAKFSRLEATTKMNGSVFYQRFLNTTPVQECWTLISMKLVPCLQRWLRK